MKKDTNFPVNLGHSDQETEVIVPLMAAKQCLLLAFLSFLLFPALAFPLERGKSLAIIREINSKGPYLGLITVYPPEENAFFAAGAFKNDSNYPYVDLRFRVGMIEDKKVIYVRCGVGLVNAAAATQQMLDLFHIKGLIHFGISGNTNSSLSIGDVTIPKEFANTGLWDWLKPNATVPQNDVAKLDIENYNVPEGGNNSLGRIGYGPEQFYSEAGEPNTAQEVLWFQVSNNWLQLATSLQVSVTILIVRLHLPQLHICLKYLHINIFLYKKKHNLILTSLSNGYSVIVVRGLSDLAGRQEGQNSISLFGSLAASNVAKVVFQFIKLLPKELYFHS
ncbi:hypothetical protein Pfo_027222 [Paulownia fortunei]|nr:hypothetical protein Pfo_027222 [Paulownia fortunei]